MFWESSGVVGFDLGPLLEGQMRTAKLKSAYNSLIIGPRGFGALSLRWIQFASVLRCARSSLFNWMQWSCMPLCSYGSSKIMSCIHTNCIHKLSTILVKICPANYICRPHLCT